MVGPKREQAWPRLRVKSSSLKRRSRLLRSQSVAALCFGSSRWRYAIPRRTASVRHPSLTWKGCLNESVFSGLRFPPAKLVQERRRERLEVLAWIQVGKAAILLLRVASRTGVGAYIQWQTGWIQTEHRHPIRAASMSLLPAVPSLGRILIPLLAVPMPFISCEVAGRSTNRRHHG